MSSKLKPLTYTDSDGSEKETLASRLQRWRADHPFNAGWSLVTRGELLPNKMLSPSGTEVPMALFVAEVKLNDRRVATASTFVPIDMLKAWENADSNARARVIEVMGYGRDLIDEDEGNERSMSERWPTPFNRSKTKAPLAGVPSVSDSVTKEPVIVVPELAAATQNTTTSTSASSSETTSASATVSSTNQEPPPPVVKTRRVDSTDKSQADIAAGPPTAALMQQIKNRCKALNATVPDLKTQGDAKVFWKALNSNRAPTGGAT